MPGRILLVDDDESIRTQTTVLLEDEGYDVDQAASSQEAITAFQRRRPDCVLLDVMLPDATGFDTCRALRNRSDVPIIMVTARAAEADHLRGLDLGADEYLTKPFNIKHLTARMQTLLKGHRPAGGGQSGAA